MTKFFTDGSASDRAYCICRDSKYRQPIREFVERCWSRYEAYCPDPNFLSDARSNFAQRTWEMYLAWVLTERGLRIKKTRAKGPDLCLDTTPPVWIEAIAVRAGDGPDRVLDPESRGQSFQFAPGIQIWNGTPPMEESVVLRCTAAIAEKDSKRATYVADNLIQETDPFVVALSLGAIPDSCEFCEDDEVPIIVKALFGLGDEYIEERAYSVEKPRIGYDRRPTVAKRSGATVSAQGFLGYNYQYVAGLLFTCMSISNVPDEHGAELIYVHNPNARAPLEIGTFPFGTEWVAEKGKLRRFQRSREIRR